jgi:hypothetical protein
MLLAQDQEHAGKPGSTNVVSHSRVSSLQAGFRRSAVSGRHGLG